MILSERPSARIVWRFFTVSVGKAAVTVTRCLDLYETILRLELLVHLSITAITAYRLGGLEMTVHLTLHAGVEKVFYTWCHQSLSNKGLPDLNSALATANIFAYSTCVILIIVYALEKRK